MPTVANGPDLSGDLIHNRSENAEADLPWTWSGHNGTLRLLGFWNHADMGNYRATLALDTPAVGLDIEDSRSLGAEKYGFGANVEQALGAVGTGLFARLGWNDGATESWVFTEIDRTASLGMQAGGSLWRRPFDTLGAAAVVNGLSPAHEEYLAAGGYGFIIGDGALDYGYEQILEAYYDWHVLSALSLTPDFQFVKNPAYNQARGPVEIYGLRLHCEI
jgi:high affinity Mn2+ porin